MLALSRNEVRNLDRIAVERFGIPGLILMENAGRAATDSLFRLITDLPDLPRFGVVAGRGNNGGDGFVIARHLVNRGHAVHVLILGEPDDFRGPGEAGVNFAIVERMGIPIFPIREPGALLEHLGACHVAVDAILGTGLAGEVRGLALDAIDALNAFPHPVLAVDTPSGLQCDSGKALGTAVRADATVTFAAMKRGFLEPGAADYTGPVEVVDIGCPLVWD